MKKILTSFAVLFVLAACSTNVPPTVKPEADTLPNIYLDVLSVVVIDRSTVDASDSPYATNDFQPTIANAMRLWATDHLIATGTTGEAVVVIRDASLKSEPLAHRDDWFSRQQASKYLGRAAIEIDVNGSKGAVQVSAEASRFETLPETPTTFERQNSYYILLNGLMHDLSASLRVGIHDHLGAYIVSGPVSQ